MPVKYCSTAGCRHFEHPLPADRSRCPRCDTVDLRLDPDEPGYPCPTCGEINTDPAGVCWNCSGALDYNTRSISFE